MKRRSRVEHVLYLILLLALADACWLVGKRAWREAQNKNVEIVIGYDDVVSLAKVDGLASADILAKFKQAGVVSVALAEETLADLEAEGRVTLRETRPGTTTASLNIKAEGPGLAERIANGLAAQVGPGRVRRIGPAELSVRGGLSPFEIRAQAEGQEGKLLAYPEGLENLGVGFSPAKTALIEQAGLGVVPRLGNSRWLGGRAIDAKIAGLKKDLPKAKIVIFSGEEALGYPAETGAAARALRSNDLDLGLIEFSRQSGAGALASVLGTGVVNVHSIMPEEMDGMTLDRAAARWVRAAQERGVRLFYVHPFPRLGQTRQSYGQDLTEENAYYLEKVAADLKDKGFNLGPAKVDVTIGRPLSVGLLSLLTLTLGLGAGGAFLLRELSRRAAADLARIALLVMVLLAVLAVVFYLTGSVRSWQKILAWLAAVIFPSWAVISCFARPVRLWAGRPIAWAAASLTRAVLIGLAGGLLVGAALSGNVFFLRLDQFSGVKAALVLPFLLVTYYFWKEADWGVTARRLLSKPLSLGLALLILTILAAGALFIIRSGNYLSGAVTPIEAFGRRFLETVLGVRPRTKEFLIGYPALLLAVNLASRGFRRLLVWFWALVGTLGPVSLVNTYCHLHTPFLVSLRRSANGYVLGLFFGLVLIYLFNLARLYLGEQRLRLMNERTAPLPFGP